MHDDLLDRLLGEPDGGARLLVVHGSRGCGKTWWMETARDRALAGGFQVARFDARHELVDLSSLDTTLAAPLCVIVDDIDLLDAGTRRSVRTAVEQAGGVAIASASVSSAFEGALAVRIEPLSTSAIEALLRERGVGPRAAQRCAGAAGGNPGLAVALADGLSDAQRSDLAAVPELPRLAADVATVLHDRLLALGDRACRSLMVAAADDDGDLLAIRAALTTLGEGRAAVADDADDPLAALFDEAEHAGIVDIVGGHVVFTDPWLRLAAYHLVAPASRRAAHRALAAAYAAPRQGAARVRHLVAASNGPSDTVAEALLTVAAAAARRGDRLSAAGLAAQGSELAVSPATRSGCLLRSAGWWLDLGDVAAAQRLIETLDGSDAEEQAAAIEVASLMFGTQSAADGDGADGRSPLSERELSTWRGRRRQRLSWWADAAAGHHARVLQQVGSAAAPAELLARAEALRHGGFVRDAVEVVERTLSLLPSDDSHLRRKWEHLAADLAVLTGRAEHVRASADRGATELTTVRARAAAALDPTVEISPGLIAVPAGSPLHAVRSAVLAGLTRRDAVALVEGAGLADAANLPVEAGEAWLFAAEIAALGANVAALDPAECARQASERLHRCAVRGWDARLQRLAERPASGAAAVDADPALDALSAAEWRVASAVAGGLTNREVAATLFLSVKTVDFHLQQIYRKLALRSRTELAVRVAGRVPNQVGREASGTQGATR